MDLCPVCAFEHLGQSLIYLEEASASHEPERIMEKLVDAADHLLAAQYHMAHEPEFAKRIREVRKRVQDMMMSRVFDPGILELIGDIRADLFEMFPEAETIGQVHQALHGKPLEPEEEDWRAITPEMVERARRLFGIEPWAWTECELRYPDVQEKMRRCVIKVVHRMPDACLIQRAWGQEIEGVRCVNPVAVCRAAIRCPP